MANRNAESKDHAETLSHKAERDVKRLIGRNVSRLREERDMTQGEVAARAGKSQSYISTLEAGGQNACVETLCKIARAMDVNMLALFEEADGEEKSRPRR